MKSPLTLAAGLALILSLLGFSLYELLSDESASESGEVITHAAPAGDGEALPEPAPGRKVAITSQTPREKLRQEKYDEAQAELAWIREHGEKVGDFYRMEANGQEYFVLGELAKGFGRNGQPIYSVVKATKLPMGERRVPANSLESGSKLLHVDNAKDLPNFSMPKGVQKTMEGVGPQSAGNKNGEAGQGNTAPGTEDADG